MPKTILLILILSVSRFIGEAPASDIPLELPGLFSDHMVLQQDISLPIWGRTAPGALVQISFAGELQTVRADTRGDWRTHLSPLPASTSPREMHVTAQLGDQENKIILRDILIGEVWFCAGQSNMEMVLFRTLHAERLLDDAAQPLLRLYKTPRVASLEPEWGSSAAWRPSTPDSARWFSGVAYSFGRKLLDHLDVPIGLIMSASGSTRIESWTNPEVLNDPPDDDVYLSGDFLSDRRIPGALFNGMVHPHIPYAIRGVIWYQGEANRLDGMGYVDKKRRMLEDWRDRWEATLPFLFVQIAPYQYGEEDPFILPEFWAAQAAIVREIPKTGMVVVNDHATLDDIHPPDKIPPGQRLARMALNRVYHRDIACEGPTLSSVRREGDTLIVSFDAADGLNTRDGQPPDWFEIASCEGSFAPAQPRIAGTEVVLSSDLVPNPTQVRFAWHKLAKPNLINGEGLPAVPFHSQYAPAPMNQGPNEEI